MDHDKRNWKTRVLSAVRVNGPARSLKQVHNTHTQHSPDERASIVSPVLLQLSHTSNLHVYAFHKASMTKKHSIAYIGAIQILRSSTQPPTGAQPNASHLLHPSHITHHLHVQDLALRHSALVVAVIAVLAASIQPARGHAGAGVDPAQPGLLIEISDWARRAGGL